jgi:hypothetical protein
MPEVRKSQAERRFVAFGFGRMGGHSPFRGLDATRALILSNTTECRKNASRQETGEMIEECVVLLNNRFKLDPRSGQE